MPVSLILQTVHGKNDRGLLRKSNTLFPFDLLYRPRYLDNRESLGREDELENPVGRIFKCAMTERVKAQTRSLISYAEPILLCFSNNRRIQR